MSDTLKHSCPVFAAAANSQQRFAGTAAYTLLWHRDMQVVLLKNAMHLPCKPLALALAEELFL